MNVRPLEFTKAWAIRVPYMLGFKGLCLFL